MKMLPLVTLVLLFISKIRFPPGTPFNQIVSPLHIHPPEFLEMPKTSQVCRKSINEQDALGESKPPPSAFEFVVQYL